MSEPTVCENCGSADLGAFGSLHETDRRIWWKPWRKRWEETTTWVFCTDCDWAWSPAPLQQGEQG